jgi:hypothetical protein
MSIVECGCNGQLSGHLLDGEPYIERTTDIGFCALHAAAPKLLAALKGLLEHVKMHESKDLLICGHVTQAEKAIREADLGVQKSVGDEASS